MTSFMEQNTPIQFGIDFKDVSISNLISFDIVREHIDKAESFYNDGNLYECLVNSKIAFLELLSSYENNKKGKYSCDSLLNIGDHIGKDFQKLVGTNDNDGARWFKQVTDSTNQIREILKIIALGIDFKKYTYFEAITPTIQSWWKDGLITHEAWPKNLFEERNHLRKIDCRFCIDFVIDSSLKLQEFDYDINNIIK